MSHPHEWYKKWKSPKIVHGKPSRWGWVVLYPENLKLGRFTDIGVFSVINAKYGGEIQEGVQIGSHCSIYSHSTIDDKKGKVVIKKNARIGSHSVVMPGITIGENSVVGAFSFVNKDVPNNVAVTGVPAKIMRKINRKNR